MKKIMFNDKYGLTDAFAESIGKVGKKGTWDSNPFVFRYEFKLIK